MDIKASAKALGELVAGEEVTKSYKKALVAYRTNTEIQKMITEYNAQRAALGEAYKPENKDEALINTIKERVDKIFEDITNHPVYQRFTETQDEMNKTIDMINHEITDAIFGDIAEESSCTHDCSTCGGGCH